MSTNQTQEIDQNLEQEPEEEIEESEEGENEESEEDRTEETSESGAFGMNFLAVDGMMLFYAIILDITGLFITLFGLDDFGILDMCGVPILCWIAFKSGAFKTKKEVKRGVIQKLFRGKYSRYFVSFIGESIPWLGGLLCCWSLAVYYEFKES